MDDVLVRSETFAKHLSHLRSFFEKIRETGLKLKLKKTLFCRDEVPFLGFVLSKEGIRPDQERVCAILEVPEPRTRKELQRFIGMCTYYRKIHERYARFIEPFRPLLSANNKFV